MVLVFSEDRETLTGGLVFARTLADSLKAPLSVLVSSNDEGDYGALGADFVYRARFEARGDSLASVLVQLASELNLSALLIGSTRLGREVAPRTAQRLNAGCVTDCTEMYAEGGEVFARRLTLGGRFSSTLKFLTKPAVMTYPTGSPQKGAPAKRTAKAVDVEFTPVGGGVEVIESVKKAAEGVRLEEADVIVAAGRGVRKKEDLKMVEELASVLGGVVGCSSPLSADLKWLPEERQIGLSGKKVRPRLYIAVGISGQTQHIAGIREARTIVAINSDPNAPIFKACDYGIVGDLYDVVPRLIKELQKKS